MDRYEATWTELERLMGDTDGSKSLTHTKAFISFRHLTYKNMIKVINTKSLTEQYITYSIVSSDIRIGSWHRLTGCWDISFRMTDIRSVFKCMYFSSANTQRSSKRCCWVEVECCFPSSISPIQYIFVFILKGCIVLGNIQWNGCTKGWCKKMSQQLQKWI